MFGEVTISIQNIKEWRIKFHSQHFFGPRNWKKKYCMSGKGKYFVFRINK